MARSSDVLAQLGLAQGGSGFVTTWPEPKPPLEAWLWLGLGHLAQAAAFWYIVSSSTSANLQKPFCLFWAFPVADKLTSEPKFENLLHRCS